MMIWCSDYCDVTYTDAKIRDLEAIADIAVMFGHSVEADFPNEIRVVVRSTPPPTDFFMAGEFPIISSTLRVILDDFHVSGEYFPVLLEKKHQRSPSSQSWYCFNLLSEVDCLDRAKSVYCDEKGWATKITRLALDDSKIGGIPATLVAKAIPMLIVVQDKVAQGIVEAGCTGLHFTSPSEWRNIAHP